jgi:hypothetical protein
MNQQSFFLLKNYLFLQVYFFILLFIILIDASDKKDYNKQMGLFFFTTYKQKCFNINNNKKGLYQGLLLSLIAIYITFFSINTNFKYYIYIYRIIYKNDE